ncbi:hypothetical protein H5410_054307 [Solanum commersonii]|uniref:Polyprotein n=1 Tax=Solanum commersonii TaxID=4109 RepID=A0A9J5X9W2_SOLCO|nr:hypothetical protein H5410_054307 [Solanum commersonii]
MYAGKGNQYVGRMPTDLMMYSGNGKAMMHPGNGQGNFNYSRSTDSMALYTGRGGYTNTGTGHGLVYSGQGSTDGSGAYAMQPKQGEWPQTLAAQPTFTYNQYNQILQKIDKEEPVENMANAAGTSNTILSVGDKHMCMTMPDVHKGQTDWIVDSGATCHMTSKLSNLDEASSTIRRIGKKVHLPNGQTTSVTHTGDCKLLAGDILSNVLVPVFPQPTFGEADAETLSDIPIDSDIYASDNDGLEQIPEDVVHDAVLDEPLVDVAPDDAVSVEPRTRQSTRVSNPPVWMKDFVTNVTDPNHPYSMANYIAYQHLSLQYQTLLDE